MNFLYCEKSEHQLLFFIVQCWETKQQGELSLWLHSKKIVYIFFLLIFNEIFKADLSNHSCIGVGKTMINCMC